MEAGPYRVQGVAIRGVGALRAYGFRVNGALLLRFGFSVELYNLRCPVTQPETTTPGRFYIGFFRLRTTGTASCLRGIIGKCAEIKALHVSDQEHPGWRATLNPKP